MNLAKALTLLERYVPNKHYGSGHIKLTKDKAIKCNWESEMEITIDDANFDRTIVVFGKTLSNAVNSLEEYKIEIGANTVTLYDSSRKFELPLMPEDDYPSLETEETVFSAELDFEQIADMTVFCSRDQNRPQLMCIRLEDSVAVATDGYRLAYKKINANIERPILIEKDLPRIVMDVSGGMTRIHVCRSHLTITAGQMVYRRRVVEREFPNWKAVIPNLSEINFVTLPADELVRAMKIMTIVHVKESQKSTFPATNLELKKDSLVISTSSQYGNVEASIDVRSKEQTSIKLDAEFGLHAAEHVAKNSTDKNLLLGIHPPLILITDTERNILHLIMQIKE